MSITVKRVQGRNDLKEFVTLPWDTGIYRNDPSWVPPLIQDQLRFLSPRTGYFYEIGEADLFIVYKNGKPAGRISAHINSLHDDLYGHGTGFFGFYECINDDEVSRVLFDTACNSLAKKNRNRICGPQSFAVYDSNGFNVQCVNGPPSTGVFHYAAWYTDQADKYGFQKYADWYNLNIRTNPGIERYIKRARQFFQKATDIRIRSLEKNKLQDSVHDIAEIFNISWDGNQDHLPFTKKQIESLAGELSSNLVPELVNFAEVNGKIVGFMISVPDISPGLQALNGRCHPLGLLKFSRLRRKTRRLRTMIMGVLPEYRGRNIHNMLFVNSFDEAIKRGYQETDCSLIAESNKKMLYALHPFGGRITGTYRIFEKNLVTTQLPG